MRIRKRMIHQLPNLAPSLLQAWKWFFIGAAVGTGFGIIVGASLS